MRLKERWTRTREKDDATEKREGADGIGRDISVRLVGRELQGDLSPMLERGRKKKTDPCLSVTIDREGNGVWHCFHCEWAGGAKNGQPTYQRQENVADLINGTSNGVNGVAISAPRKQTYDLPPALEIFALGDDAKKFFSERKVSPETLAHFRISECNKWMPQIGIRTRALVFPYLIYGRLVNRKYRALSEKAFVQDRNCRRTPFNVDAIKEAETMVIVEGEMDVIALHEAGVRNVISPPDGAGKSGNAKRIEALNRLHLLDGRRQIVLAGDMDEPGRALRSAIAEAAAVECWSVDWGDCKDGNEVLMRHGAEKVRECLRSPEKQG